VARAVSLLRVVFVDFDFPFGGPEFHFPAFRERYSLPRALTAKWEWKCAINGN